MWQNVTYAIASRQNTRGLQDCLSHWMYLCGSGKAFPWFSYLDYPHSPKGNDYIWVIVDRLTKVAHFIAVKTTYWTDKLAELYMDNILRLHGAPVSIVLDRGTQFMSKFWKSLYKAIRTRLDYRITYHPQTDEQKESELDFGGHASILCVEMCHTQF